MTATQPIAVLRGAGARPCARRGAPRALLRTGGLDVTLTGPAPAPTTIVFGTDGWRARIADEFTFENVRRCADGVAALRRRAGRDGQGRRRRLRPALRVGALRDGRRRGPPRARHPGRLRGPRRADPDELVRGRRARRRGRHRHHRQPQPVGRQRLQGQGPDRCRGRARTSSASSSAGSRPTAGSGIDRRPFADAEAAGLVERFDPYEGYERFVRRTVDLDALRDADMSILVDPMWGAGSGWLSRLLAGGRIRVDEIHQERNPYFGGVNPEPIRPNIDEALGRSGRAAATTSGCCSTATRTAPAPPTSAARSSTSSR